MKYFILTFNEDWADEHDVPALEAMTEVEYNKWLSKEFGELNLNYEKEIANYKAYQAAKKELDLEIKTILGDRRSFIRFSEWPKELAEKYNGLPQKYGYTKAWPAYPKKVSDSEIYAQLGNNGQNFNEQFNHCFTGQDFIDKNYVSVTEVNKEFYKTFNDIVLSSLSLCNIFE